MVDGGSTATERQGDVTVNYAVIGYQQNADPSGGPPGLFATPEKRLYLGPFVVDNWTEYLDCPIVRVYHPDIPLILDKC